ncbi:MAG TPA: molybdenum cofactor guanylyltransferase [Crocinitomix sp.]|nr:molybdenum cofactor guanylyltransferase [Crocinitomix sp.]
MEITGVILAGGKSSRMGQDKGLLKFNGKSLIQYAIDTLKPITSQIIIIANNYSYNTFNYPVYNDIIKNKGPVGGIYTALTHSQTKTNIILSCDTPFVSTELLKLLLAKHQNYDVTLPKYNHKIHPIVGIYNTSNLSHFKQSLYNNHLKLIEVNQQINTQIVEIDTKHFKQNIFYNINTPTQLKQAIK